jgi:ATP/maltotriose-dependent transcriptional regulator MalT
MGELTAVIMPVRVPEAGEQRLAADAGLTNREADVLRLLAEGLSNQQIADKLVVSPLTVRAHLRAVYAKLEVGSRTAAVRKAGDLGLL